MRLVHIRYNLGGCIKAAEESLKDGVVSRSSQNNYGTPDWLAFRLKRKDLLEASVTVRGTLGSTRELKSRPELTLPLTHTMPL
jgi:hypothetical protein